MHLTKVELLGFKSFADKTVFDFDRGITAILGPNGCGKSNVVDAIKWVLGETRPTALRGKEMQDVIFAGSERRKPVGLAEVNLYFDNAAGTLPVAYNEVCITRRLYRSGESEYLINKQPCRKRDIRDLFLDTGVGTSAYSVIEQGKVEELLQAKPADRRAIFEEAAGISKFKQRRKETLARLERTEQYLHRVNDVVEEVEKQIRSKTRQASAARRYQRLKEDLDLLKTVHYARDCQALQAKLRERQRQMDELAELFTRESVAQSEAARQAAGLTSQEMDLDQALERHDQALLELQETLGRIQREIGTAGTRLESLAEEKTAACARVEFLEARLEAMAREDAEDEAERHAAAAELTTMQERLAAEDARRSGLQYALDGVAQRIEETRAALLALGEERSQAQQARTRAESDAEALAARQAEHRERSAANAARDAELDTEQRRLETARAEAEAETAARRDELETARAAERDRLAEAESLNEKLNAVQAELSAKTSRLATLQDLEKNLAGAYAGVKAVMSAQREGRGECAAVRGMVADLLRVPAELALAIETALGAHAQDIVVADADGAQRCVDYLKTHRAGRATFLPLDTIRPRRPLEPQQKAGGLGEAIDLVDFDAEYRPALEYLLHGTLIAETLQDARRLSTTSARGVRIVTREGEVIDPRGAITGGHGAGVKGGLITRKAEMESLEKATETLRGDLEQLGRERRRALDAAAQARANGEALDRVIETKEHDTAKLATALSVCESERQRLDEERAARAREAETMREAAAAIAARQEEAEALLAGMRDRQEEAEDRLAKQLQEQSATRTALDVINERTADLREKRANLQAQAEDFARRLAQRVRDREERAQELAQLRERGERARSETAALEERLQTAQAEEREALEKRDRARAEGVTMREQLAGVRERLEEQRQAERACQKRLGEIQEGQHELQLAVNQARMRLETLSERAREELGIEDLSAAAGKLLAEDEPARDEPDEEAHEDPRQLAPAALAERIEEVQGKIGRIGPVNLCAIEELAELEARVEFLRSEQEDIQTAAQDLMDLIERLNTECATRFEATFDAVRENFQELFRMLFGGGKADLILEAPENGDALDAGIEIIARPPGKEPKSISLLSGGEKALCTVALLFAIFRSKPSPFCILDEVDGPLDESNIDRFMNAVRDFSQETQFILISHAKRTMGMTDAIYGVTQDEPGISTKYSLRFTDAYERVEDGEAEGAGQAPVREVAFAGADEGPQDAVRAG